MKILFWGRARRLLAAGILVLSAAGGVAFGAAPAHAGTITPLPGQPAITDYQPPSGAGSNSVPYEHQGALIVAGQSQLGSQPIKDASTAGATVLGYLDPMVIQPNSGTWGDMLWQSSACGPAVPQWGSYTTGTGYALADFRTTADGGNGIEQAKLKCVLENMISTNPWIAGLFADDLGSMSWYPNIPWGSFPEQQHWRDGAIALAQTFHDVAVEHHDMLMVNGTWEAGTLASSGGGYPTLSTNGLSLADGGYIEHHAASEVNFWVSYAQGQWGTAAGDASQGSPIMYVQASDLSTMDTYLNTGVFSYLSYQTDYSQPAPVWGSFHATGLPSSSTFSSGPSGPCVNGQFGVATLAGNYNLQANEFNSTTPFTACSNDGGPDFTVTQSSISAATNGAPGGYPSLYVGCHWGTCTPSDPFPIPVSSVGTDNVTTTNHTTVTTSGAWDDAYDIWFNVNQTTTNNSTNGVEMMIWQDHLGGVQPAGSQVATATIDGIPFNVWWSGSTLTYEAQSPTDNVDNLALAGFTSDAVGRGYLPSSDYLIDVEAGTEIWQGNQGFADNQFSVSVGTGTTQQAPAVVTNAASGVTTGGATLNGTVNPEGAATNYQFDYGTTTSYGSHTTAASAGSGTSAVAETASLTGLSPSTTYHYRIEATNSAGTSFGGDQSFTTSASGGTAVAFDGSAGARAANVSSLEWTQTVGTGSNRELLVDETIGNNTDNGCVPSATYDGIQMHEVTAVGTDNQRNGVMVTWALANPPSGTDTIHIAVSGCTGVTQELTGGSESFTGVNQTTPINSHVNGYGYSTTASVTAATASSSDLLVEFVACGSGINNANSPVVQRFIENQDTNTGAGNTGGGYRSATGGSDAASWSVINDYWGTTAVDLNHA